MPSETVRTGIATISYFNLIDIVEILFSIKISNNAHKVIFFMGIIQPKDERHSLPYEEETSIKLFYMEYIGLTSKLFDSD